MSTSIKLAQYRGEALHAVSQLGLSADGEALAAITELATKHLLFAIELLMNRLVKSQAIEIIRLANTTVDSGQAGELLMKRLASSQTETQESVEALIGKIRSVLIPTRAAIDRSINLITQDRAPSMAGSSTDKQLRKGIETILDLTFPSEDAPTSELLLKATLQKFLEGFHAPYAALIQSGACSVDPQHAPMAYANTFGVKDSHFRGRMVAATDALTSIARAFGLEDVPSQAPWIESTRDAVLVKIRQLFAAQPSLFTTKTTPVTHIATPRSTADSTTTTVASTTMTEADGSFDLTVRAEDDIKYEKMLGKLKGLSGDISPPDGWQERAIRAAHMQKTVDNILSSYYAVQGRHTGDDGIKATELSCYAVGDHVSFLRRHQVEDLWNLGTVTRVESWLRQDGTVGHRIEVNEWLDTIGTLRYGCWIYEDGDESTLRRAPKSP